MQKDLSKSALPTSPLGRTGVMVTRLGYGSMGIRGPRTWGVRDVSDAAAEAILNQVLDCGINFIDTSPDYGVAEERIGRFISSRRGEFILATKCGCVYRQEGDHLHLEHHWEKSVIERNLETSLARLQTDTIDLLQFHGGDAETLQEAGLIQLLEGFKRQGLIRWIGVSSKLPEIERLHALGVFDTFQLPFSALAPEHAEVITRIGQSGAGVIVRGGIAHGGPDAEIQREQLNQVWDQAGLEDFISEDMLRAELILRYTLSQPYLSTTIVGTCNPEHLAENVAAARRGPLPANIFADICHRVANVLG